MLHAAGEEILACPMEQKDNICCHCTASKLGNLTTTDNSRAVTTELSSNTVPHLLYSKILRNSCQLFLYYIILLCF